MKGKIIRAGQDNASSMEGALFFCYGEEENARIYAVHLTTADQSGIRRAHLVSAANEQKL